MGYRERRASLEQSGLLTAGVTGLSVAVALVAAASLANALILSVLERRREIAVMRVIGGRRRALAATLLAETLALSLLAWGVGVVCGRLLARILVDLVGRNLFRVRLWFGPTLLLGSLLAMVVLAAVTMWTALRQALRFPLPESLRYE